MADRSAADNIIIIYYYQKEASIRTRSNKIPFLPLNNDYESLLISSPSLVHNHISRRVVFGAFTTLAYDDDDDDDPHVIGGFPSRDTRNYTRTHSRFGRRKSRLVVYEGK